MIELEEKTIYQAFGLNIKSEFSLPELFKAENLGNIDVVIERKDLSNQWNNWAEAGKNYITRGSEVLFQVPNTSLFSIQEGSRIAVSPMNAASEDKIRLYLLGTCMAILLMQRKFIPLHGSAVAINGKAYAFVGERGAGKSTIASAFIKDGYKLLTDDIISVTNQKDNEPYVIPSYPQQKLWQESLKEFGLEFEGFKPLFDRETKYAVPVEKEFHSEPLPLAGVFELIKVPEVENISIKPIEGLGRLHILYAHTFRQFLLNRIGIREWHFHTTALFAQKLDIYQMKRPTLGFTANQLVTLVLETINKGK
jgi:hypothetical protein